MAVYYCISLFMAVYYCISLFMAVYYCISLFMAVYYCISLFMAMYYCISIVSVQGRQVPDPSVTKTSGHQHWATSCTHLIHT